MNPITTRLLLILALTATAASQSDSDTTNSSDTRTVGQCYRPIDSANASGIFAYSVDYPLPQSEQSGQITRYIPDPSWAVTVNGGNGKDVQRRLWYSPAGQDYADDLSIEYDVCAFIFSSLPTNTLRLGQNDSGNCSSMLTQPCIDKLTSVASASAHQWVTYSSPPPYENLTAGVLPSICGYIYRDLFDAAQEQCGNELGVNTDIDKNSAVINTEALTGFNDSILYSANCTPHGDGKTFHRVPVPINRANNDWRSGTDAGYDNATRDILPILTVYMPVANVKRTSFYSVAPSALQCVRTQQFSESSRVSPSLPKGTPWPSSSAGGLSGKAKGGVIAGVVVFVVLVAGLLFLLWLIKRKKRRAREAEAARLSVAQDEKLPPEADGSLAVHELNPRDKKPELDGGSVAEMEGGGGRPPELATREAPVELSAERHS